MVYYLIAGYNLFIIRGNKMHCKRFQYIDINKHTHKHADIEHSRVFMDM